MIQRFRPVDRRTFIGRRPDHHGADEPALLQLWREKRGELEPEGLSGNLIVQLGLVTEAIVADRSAPQKHVRRANIIPATADGCVLPRSRFFRRRSWCFGWCGGPGHLLAQAGDAPYVAAKSARTSVSCFDAPGISCTYSALSFAVSVPSPLLSSKFNLDYFRCNDGHTLNAHFCQLLAVVFKYRGQSLRIARMFEIGSPFQPSFESTLKHAKACLAPENVDNAFDQILFNRTFRLAAVPIPPMASGGQFDFGF
jgi:hypothetical protein